MTYTCIVFQNPLVRMAEIDLESQSLKTQSSLFGIFFFQRIWDICFPNASQSSYVLSQPGPRITETPDAKCSPGLFRRRCVLPPTDLVISEDLR